MDAEAVKHLGGMCQVLGVVLVLRDVLNLARYRGELADAANKVRALWSASVARARRLLGLPGRAVSAHAGLAGGFAMAGTATVARGIRGPFTPQPGQSLQDQGRELGTLVNRLREEVIREPRSGNGPSPPSGRPGRRSCGPWPTGWRPWPTTFATSSRS
jgi:hypothetical protein